MERKRLIILVVVVCLLLTVVIIGVAVGVHLGSKQSSYLLFYPKPDTSSNLISFEQGKPTSYKMYVDNMQAKLQAYENDQQQGEYTVDCEDGGYGDNLPDTKVCFFDITQLGSECTKQKNFGYHDGQPCILLELRPPINWTPGPPDNVTDFEVRCRAEDKADEGNLGKVRYFPQKGFPRIFFPNRGTEGYRAPLVMVQLQTPRNGVELGIQCTVSTPDAPKNKWFWQAHFKVRVD